MTPAVALAANETPLALLLVNDDAGALFALRTVLSDLEVDIVTASSGEQALLRLLRQDFCVILMDVKMAGLDGFETARLIRSRPRSRDTPIVFLTSHRATDLDRSRGYQVGARDYVFLPVAPAILKAKVQTYIDSAPDHRMQRQGDGARPAPERSAGGARSPGSAMRQPLHDEAAEASPGQDPAAVADIERLILEHAGDYIALLDASGAWLYASTSYREQFGDALRRKARYLDIVHPEDRERLQALFEQAPAGQTHRRLQYRVTGPEERYFESDANLILSPTGTLSRIVLVSHDITERKEMDAYVLHQSFHDSLTGLPNRLLLLDRLSQATAHRAQQHTPVAVLFMDLDHFKEVNDTLGHAAGDRLLQVVTERLAASVREGDTVARVGGDEFVIVLVDLHQLADAARVAEKIIAAVSSGCQIAGSELHVVPSIGVAVFPDDGGDPDTLLRNADTAMYHAKRDGGAHYCFFTREMQEVASRRLALGSALERAIHAGEFVMHYQPKVRAASGAIVGFEALIRWPQADGESIPPSQFIPIAEETGRIDRIGSWAIRQVAAELQRWQALGMTIAVDDFGTGYSSLAYLKRFPIDKLKIDASFVRDIASDPGDAAIVLAIITLAHVLELTVIAEGVETEAQLAFLVAHGCDELQGNYFSAALSNDDAVGLLRRGPFSIEQPTGHTP